MRFVGSNHQGHHPGLPRRGPRATSSFFGRSGDMEDASETLDALLGILHVPWVCQGSDGSAGWGFWHGKTIGKPWGKLLGNIIKRHRTILKNSRFTWFHPKLKALNDKWWFSCQKKLSRGNLHHSPGVDTRFPTSQWMMGHVFQYPSFSENLRDTRNSNGLQ